MKNMKRIIFLLFLGLSLALNAQNLVVSDDSTFTGTSNNALFEVHSASSNKGILIPRLTTAQRTSIATTNIDEGLVVYDTDTHSFWVWSGSQWTELGDKQTLSLSGNNLSISNGNSVDISSVNTDNQTLYLSGNNLSISGGNSVDLTNSINNTAWSLNGNTITSGQFLGTTNNENLVFKTNNTTQAIITSDGKIGVGTTTPQVKFEINSNLGDEFIRLDNGTTNPLKILFGNDYANYQNNDGVVYFEITGNETYIFGGEIMPDGDASRRCGAPQHRWSEVYAANGTIQTSDLNDKTSIKPLKYGLKEILKLNPITFKWKNDKLNLNDYKIGLSAQELQKVLPEVVVKDKKNPNASLGVMYSDIIPVLVNAIKQQQQQIDELKKQNEEILKRLEEMSRK
jgi:hypothetical protein